MKKILVTLLTVSIVASLAGCNNSAGVSSGEVITDTSSSQTEENTTNQESISDTTTEQTTTTEAPTTTEPPTTTPAPTTTEPPTTTNPSQPTTFKDEETTVIKPVTYEGPIAANSFTEHGKVLNVYGDIDATDERVIKLQNTLLNYNKRISLVAWRKDGTKALSYNTNQTFFSACTIKIGFILQCCKVIDSGAVDENTLLTYEARHYHDGSGKIKKSEYGTQYSIKTLINLCLSISDNVAYKMLAEYFGTADYNAMVESLGCTSLKVKTIWASNAKAKDYIVIWNEVYDYLNSGAKMAPVLKDACTNTPFNYGTETLVGVDYSHKSGDNFGASAVYNDAGIVWEDNAYIYAVFTNSEGTSYDINTVDTAMEYVYELMK